MPENSINPTNESDKSKVSDLNKLLDENENYFYLLDAIYNSSKDAILLYSLKNEIIYYNKKFLDFWNLNDDYLSDKKFPILFQELSNQIEENFNKNLDRTLYDIDSIKTENLIKLQNGKICEGSFQPFVFKGKMIGTVWEIHDATDRVHAEQNLLHEQNLLQALLDNIPDTIYFKDINSNFTRINKAQAKLLGVENFNEAIGKNDYDFFENDHASAAFEDEQRLMREKRGLVAKVEKIRNAEGKYIWVTATKEPIFNKKGEVVGLVGISRDITLLKENEKRLKKYSGELQKLNRTKDRLFSIIAHDLRGPFNALLGLTDIIIADFDEMSPEEIKEDLGEIYFTLKNEFQLLENLLSWSRIENGSMKYEPEKVSLKEKCDFVSDVLKSNLKKKEINLKYSVHDDIYVFADPNMLVSILLNLISNAIKFTEKSGSIKIYSDDINDKIKITVEDNGVGIDNDTLPKIFGKEIHSTRGTSNESGTGFGLLICKEMVERHGGKIWVESSKGNGSKFCFTMPISK